MATALITASTLALASLVGAMFLGYTSSSGSDVLQHTTWSTFATLIVMLSHCLTMFYLIGKGRAVKDAALEANLSGEFAEAIARARCIRSSPWPPWPPTSSRCARKCRP
jgi:hypothetical protein